MTMTTQQARLAAEARAHLDQADCSQARADEHKWAAAQRLFALNVEHGLSQRAIAEAVGRSKSEINRHIVVWREHAAVPRAGQRPAFTDAYYAVQSHGLDAIDDSKARKVLRERPERIVEAIRDASPEQQQAAVDALAADPVVRHRLAAAADVARGRETADVARRVRAGDQEQRERLAHVNVAQELRKCGRALRNALLLVRECDLNADERELLAERLDDLKMTGEILTLALAGAATIDWDAELAKLREDA